MAIQGADERSIQRDSNGQALARKPLGVVRGEATAHADAAELVVIGGVDTGLRFRLAGGALVLGRSEQADLRLTDDTITNEHVRLSNEAGGWVAEAISTGSVHVNDHRAHDYLLRDGDRLRIGRTVLKVLASGDVDERYREEVSRAAVVDAVTRLWRRSAVLETIGVELDRTRRYSIPMSLLVLRLDGFAEVASDDVLRAAGSRIRTVLSRQDRLGRLDERHLVLMLPAVTLPDAAALAEKLKAALQAFVIPTEHGPVALRIETRVIEPAADDTAETIVARATA